jgi:hypothetical protein
MPLYKLIIRKATQLGGGAKWSNVYYCVVPTEQNAIDRAQFIWEFGERLFHAESTYAYAVGVNNQEDPPFTPGIEIPVPNGVARGAITNIQNGDPLPLFNTVRVDFPVVGSRPSRKFYRPPIGEGVWNGSTITGALVTGLANGLAWFGTANLSDVDGQAWTGASIVKSVTARRLGKTARLDVPPAPPLG